MSHLYLFSSTFFSKLVTVDLDVVKSAQAKKCPHCNGVLDRADYQRKPRCVITTLPEDFSIRFSLCCRRENCRRRLTPPSLRFLGRKVYWHVAIFFATLELLGPYKVSRRQVRRWYNWWQGPFRKSKGFRSLSNLFFLRTEDTTLPIALIEQCSPLSESLFLKILATIVI